MELIIEFFKLAKMFLVTKPSEQDELEFLPMRHFPSSLCAMWCGKIIYREEYENVVKWKLEKDIFWLHHRTIHLYQAKEYKSWFRYYMKYLWEWVKGNRYTIPFEVEAYANEDNLSYTSLGKLDGTRYYFQDRLAVFEKYKDHWKDYISGLYEK